MDDHPIVGGNKCAATSSEQRFEVRRQPGNVESDRARICRSRFCTQRFAAVSPHAFTTRFRDHALIGSADANSIDVAMVRRDQKRAAKPRHAVHDPPQALVHGFAGLDGGRDDPGADDVADGGADPFENLNTPEDLVRAEARLAGEGAGKGALS